MESTSHADLVLDTPDLTGAPQVIPPLASKGKRFANFCIDYSARMAIVVVAVILYDLFFAEPLPPEAYPIDDGNPLANRLMDYAVGAVIAVLYYSFSEAIFNGRSLGKLVTGTRAVREDGNPLDAGDAFGRSLWRIVPFEAFSFFGEPGGGWHDKQTRTLVVDLRK